MVEKALVVVAWHSRVQLEKFFQAWSVDETSDLFVFQHDANKEGCAATKNKGVAEAMRRGAEIVVILDDDCFPHDEARYIRPFVERHIECLSAQTGDLFLSVTDPPNRGTPYFNKSKPTQKIAASVGFWTGIGDLDAPSQLVRGATVPMTFHREIVRGQFFAMSGMNIAFRPKDWLPWCAFQPHERMDDIFMGWIFQRRAYELGYCFNLAGPLVRHSRQSNVWANLRAEAKYLEANETAWQRIAESPTSDYNELVKLLPPV